MAMEEQVEQTAQQVLQTAAQSGARITVQAGEWLVKKLLQSGGWALKKSASKVKEQVNSGRMSEKRLQKISGGDLHEMDLNPEDIREVTKSLRKSGVNYSIEQTDDGKFFLHFEGKDAEHVQHAVNRALGKLGLEITGQAPELGQDTPLQETPGSPAEQPAQQHHKHEPSVPKTTADKPEPEAKDGQATREQPKRTEKSKAPGDTRPKGKKEFKAQLEIKKNEKLHAANGIPAPTHNVTKNR